MAANFPGSLDNGTTLPNPAAGNNTNNPSHAGLHGNENSAIIALETKLGIGSSTPSGANLLVSTGAGTSAWTKVAPTGTIVGTTDSQTLTNKTLTSPTINSPNITNATITADAVTGFTTANTGTVYGVPVTLGVIQSVNTVDGASLKAVSVQNTALASGIQTTKFSNPYKFSVYRNAGYTTVNATPTKLPYDTTEFDTSGNTTGSNKFTAPVNGFYQINARFSVATSSVVSYIMLYKNGVEFKRGELSAPNNQYNGVNLSVLVSLVATDYLEIYYVVQAALTMETGASNSYFQGFLVSAT